MSARDDRKLVQSVHLIDLATELRTKKRENELARSASLFHRRSLLQRAFQGLAQQSRGGGATGKRVAFELEQERRPGTPEKKAKEGAGAGPSSSSPAPSSDIEAGSCGPAPTASMRGESEWTAGANATSSEDEEECTSALRPPLPPRGLQTPFLPPPSAAIVLNDSTPLALDQKERLIERLTRVREGAGTRVRTRGKQQTLSRSDLVTQVLDLFAAKSSPTELLAPLAITFQGEEGIDSGGLTAELFTSFFREALAPAGGLFSPPGLDSCFVLPLPLAELSSGSRPGSNGRTLADFRSLGRIIAKSCLAFVPLPRCLAPSVFKALLGLDRWPLTLEDLEAVDPCFGRNLRLVLECRSDADLAALCIYPEEGGEGGLQTPMSQAGSKEDKRSRSRSLGSPSPLKLADVPRFLRAQVHGRLLEGRETPLEQIRLGMADLAPVYAELVDLTPKGLREALCGKLELSSQDLIDVLSTEQAQKTERGARACGYLLEILRGWDEGRLRDFLLLNTGLPGIPLGGLNNPDATPTDKIRLMPCRCSSCTRGNKACAQLPTVSTCFYTLRLPGCETREELERRLIMALDYGSCGFGAA